MPKPKSSAGYGDGVAITPADATDLATWVNAFMVTVAGDVTIQTWGGNTLLVPGCLVGVIYDIGAKQVHATGTTATGIVGLYE